MSSLQIRIGLLLLLVLLLEGCAVRSPYDEVSDPLEPVNRAVYKFNDTLDRYLLKPVAERYQEYVPAPARTGVRNFFVNINVPVTAVNNLLQWKPEQAISDVMRFSFNTVFGVAGLMDVATDWGLEKHNEDFGQTFAVWGFGEGWYLVLPFLGPSTVRDTAGLPPEAPLNTVVRYTDNPLQASLLGVFLVSKRAELLSASKVLETAALDEYLQVRAAYRQKRWFDIHDGDPPEPDFFDEELFEDSDR